MQSTPSQTPASVTPRTWKPTTAGILCIIAGVINLLIGIAIAAIGGAFGMMWGIPGWIAAIGAPIIVFGVISIAGGIIALQRRLWGLALAGAIFALFPPQVIVLGILAIIFLAISKNEFS